MNSKHSLYGRQAEIDAVSAAFDTLEASSHARCISIAGLAGVGKTAFLEAVRRSAVDRGWFVAAAPCYLVRATLPMSGIRDLIVAVTRELGERAPRYLEELPAVAPSGAISESFHRLLEALLCDSPVLLTVDDVQWLDAESESSIANMLQVRGNAPIVVAVAERGREARRLQLRGALGVRLGLLETEAIRHIAIDEGVEGAAVVDAIASRAAGHPLTARLLARAARRAHARDESGVPESIRATVASTVAEMTPSARENVQICSLMDEPIDLQLLARLLRASSPDVAAAAVDRDDFLVRRERVVTFEHAAEAEAVRQTIAVDVPYRRRILEAMQSIPHPTLEDYERIVRQAKACGEQVVERDSLLALAREAIAQRSWSTAAGAFERAFAIAPPPDHEYAQAYLTYTGALIASDNPRRARDVLREALDGAGRLELEGGFGELAAQYIAATWYEEAFDEIPAIYERYASKATSPADRFALNATLAMYYAFVMERASFEQARARALADVERGSTPRLVIRLRQSEAAIAARSGAFPAAAEAMRRLEAAVDPRELDHVALLSFMKMLVGHLEYGLAPVTKYLAEAAKAGRDEGALSYVTYVAGYAAIARGELDAAELLVENSLTRWIDRVNFRRILSISAAVAALRQEGSSHVAAIDDALSVFDSTQSESAVPLAAWWSAAVATDRPERARELAWLVLERVRRPLQPPTLFVPYPLALYAVRAKDQELLGQLATGDELDAATPWTAAHRDLVRGIARAELNYPEAARLLTHASAQFSALGAPLYAAIAALHSGAIDAKRSALLREAGVIGEPDARRLSPREAQIAALQSSGLSPVEIARTLVLSERTVEGHIERMRVKTAIRGDA